MELQLVMDADSESLGEAVWLPSSLSPTYHQISQSRTRVDGETAGQQTSLIYEEAQNILWQDNQFSPKNSLKQHPHQQKNCHYTDSPLSSCSQSPEHKLLVNQTNFQPFQESRKQQPQALKRRASELFQQQQQHDIAESERKLSRRNGSVESNNSQEWSTQVEELTEHLTGDYDDSLSEITRSDLSTAVTSYNMSEALLTLPSLTVFKQEAPSPENQQNSTILNPLFRRNNNVSLTNNTNNDFMEADSNNNGHNSSNLQQLIYTSNDECPSHSICGNQVSSSQQGNDFNEEYRFQYILAAATSIATKVNEETLTYLNQGQSYEIKLKKLSDLSPCHGEILKSTIRICFHERRLQYSEREQILAWQRARPGEHLLEIDVPLSYGIVDVYQPCSFNNSVDFMWDSSKEVGCYLKINCISTEFTPKKHGGEKGVPFRIQVETRSSSGIRLHAASCQVKVFKLKGADRKHKQDRYKIQRRPPHEQEKYQPSYDCTILTNIPLDSISQSNLISQNVGSPYASSSALSPQSRVSVGGSSSSIAAPLALSTTSGIIPIITNSESVKEDIGTASALPSPTIIAPEQTYNEIKITPCQTELPADANAVQMSSWLRTHHFHAFETTFANFSASDILRLSRDDLIQICGLPDGIRLFNALHARAPQPKLSLYFAVERSGNANATTAVTTVGVWRAMYLDSLTTALLTSKLVVALGLAYDRLHSVLLLGPQGIHVLVTNELIANMKDKSMFIVKIIKEPVTDRYKLILKPSYN